MIEEKARGSVWSVAMVAVFIFIGAMSFAGIFTSSKTETVAASAVN